jgi:hypothetical protein
MISASRRAKKGFQLILAIGLFVAYLYLKLWKQDPLEKIPSSIIIEKPENHFPIPLSLVLVTTSWTDIETIASRLELLLHRTLTPYELIVVNHGDDAIIRAVDEYIHTHLEYQSKMSERTLNMNQGLQKYFKLKVKTSVNEVGAFQAGIRNATGQYIALLDGSFIPSDYAWERFMIETLAVYPDISVVSAQCTETMNEDGCRAIVTSKVQIWLGGTVAGLPILFRNHGTEIFTQPDIKDSRISKYLNHWCESKMGSGKANCVTQGIKTTYFGPDASEKAPISALGKVIARHMYNQQIRHIDGHQQHLNQRTILTGCSDNHYTSVINNLASVKMYEPLSRVIIYDLGMSSEHALELKVKFPEFEIRYFDFQKVPDYFNISINRGEYAWKPAVIADSVTDVGGIVVWMDAGDVLIQSLDQTWEAILQKGIYSTCSDGSVRRWTHAKTLEYFNVQNDQGILNSENFNGAFIGINTLNLKMMAQVIDKWVDCAHHRECIAPIGSNRLNHRQDQAALSVIMSMQGLNCGQSFGPEYKIHQDGPGTVNPQCLIDGQLQDC